MRTGRRCAILTQLPVAFCAGITENSGAWYANTGEKTGQGRDNAREFLRENPELSREIENKVRESLGIPLLPPALTDAEA
jgi:recombination protein RecA